MRSIFCLLFSCLLLTSSGCATNDHVDPRVLKRKGWSAGGKEHRALNRDLERISEAAQNRT